MPSECVSLFVSHKVASHRRAAQRIKTILEARAERLSVRICEEVAAGDRWREWITRHISDAQMMLVLLPETPAEMTWIAQEIGIFKAACPDGRLVALKRPGDRIPDILADIQLVEINRLMHGFLKPLFYDPSFTGALRPLNPRIADAELLRDAKQIEDALSGIVDTVSKSYAESVVVNVAHLELTHPLDLQAATVSAPSGCVRILNWDDREFLWRELRDRAEKDRGKGTFWVSEMEQVMLEIARREYPRVMSSTFRGRGQATGQIFRPHLDRVEFAGDRPVRYHFVFHEVLAPEIVRGRDEIGEVFSLLYLATRVRWEVLNPFLVRRVLSRSVDEIPQEMRDELIAQVSNSLRIIDLEAERHNMLHHNELRFQGSDTAPMSELLNERRSIREAIAIAIGQGNFEELVEKLKHALLLTCRATDLLAVKYGELVRADQQRIEAMLAPESRKRPRIRRASMRSA